MNGFEAQNPSANGSSSLDSTGAANIVAALEAIYSPRSSNETRQQATDYLESQKQDQHAAYNGFVLASDTAQPPMVRHFGCSMLEHTIRHQWQYLQQQQTTSIRTWVVNLAYDILESDPQYLRNKTAVIWVELSKKSWALDWLDMDTTLLELWDKSMIHQEFVLTMLETLSEDVFYREDAVAALRGGELTTALVEIFTPDRDYSGGQATGSEEITLRANGDGWLWRISQLVLNNGQATNHATLIKATILGALATIRSAFSWIMLPAVISTGCFQSICQLLAGQDDVEVLLGAIEAFHALYTRSHLNEKEFRALVWPMYEPENIVLLRKLYQWSVVDAQDIDETKYSLSKKFAELISFLCGHIEEQPRTLLQELDLSVFFQFTISILRHQSLFVSIPILHSWTKLLASSTIGNSAPVWTVMEPLLETACQRIIKYEVLPEDSEEPTIMFLNEDISTVPERHAFLGNYRRFCHTIVEIISQRRPLEALGYILGQASDEVNRFEQQNEPFEPSTFRRDSLTILHIDAHFTVVEAAIRGYSKWLSVHGKSPQEDEQSRVLIESKLEEWASSVLSRSFGNPMMKQRVIKLAIELSARGLDQNQGYALKVLEHILMTQPIDRPEYPDYSDAVKELHIFAANELRKLGIRNADYFSGFYDQLEGKVNEILRTSSLEEKPQAELTGLLFIIMQRAHKIDPELRWSRLQSFVEPIQAAWQSERLTNALASFESFCALLEIDQVGHYMQGKNASRIDDWSLAPLDSGGLELQAKMTNRFQQEIPLRASKTLLAISTENLRVGSEGYQIACELWHDRIPAMLPNVLSLIRHAHTFHDPSVWSAYPGEMQQIFRRVLMDRFWQAGISTGTKDQFYARITSTKGTLEGFGSSVRGKLRAIRESCYSLLFCMSRLGEHFYGYEELSGPLSEALFSTAGNLSSHQFSVLLNMSRYLIDDCPVAHREKFLPPMLSTLFTQLDRSITAEWERIVQRRSNNALEDNLAEEMKEESVLRQFTYNAIMLVTNLLDPNRDSSDKDHTTTAHHAVSHRTQRHRRSASLTNLDNVEAAAVASSTGRNSTLLRTFILSNPTVLEPILLFCTNALQVRDTRSASIITRVVRSIVPNFSTPPLPDNPISPSVAPIIREFISSSVLRSAITSLHDQYFVELQKDLAQLIATIWTCYGIPHGDAKATGADSAGQPLSHTPREVILSLPGMTAEMVDNTAQRLAETGSPRHQRAYVLELLEGVRGVSISEMGKINPTLRKSSASATGARSSELRKQYLSSTGASASGAGDTAVGAMDGVQDGDGKRPGLTDDGPDLEGIAEIFG